MPLRPDCQIRKRHKDVYGPPMLSMLPVISLQASGAPRSIDVEMTPAGEVSMGPSPVGVGDTKIVEHRYPPQLMQQGAEAEATEEPPSELRPANDTLRQPSIDTDVSTPSAVSSP
eukprot:5720399-Pyramimonas_sp.AAC.1